jgi:hypothetical protein
MKTILLIEVCVFLLGFFLWIIDDPYMPEAKLLGSSYGKSIMKWSFVAICLTYLLNQISNDFF